MITPSELGDWMGQPLDQTRAEKAILIAGGWLSNAAQVTEWPDPAPTDLLAWLYELAALAYVHNPRQMVQRQQGSVLTAWAPTALQQREMILAAARTAYNRVGLPAGIFPPAQAWPDPAIPRSAAAALGSWC